eukprot:g981.t1
MASSSIARQLLSKQLVELTKDETNGFSVGLEDDSDLFKWRVCFEGPQDSVYEGGLFTAVLSFPSDFPNSPPTMQFETEMFHPNVYPDGKVCISILHPPGTDQFNEQETADERWRPILGVESILMSVMAGPGAVMYREQNKDWKKKVRALARKSIEG